MASRVAKTASEQKVDFLYAVWCVWRIPASSKVGSMRHSRRDSRILEITDVIVIPHIYSYPDTVDPFQSL